MPTYDVKDPQTGKSLKLTGDSPPTEAELNDIFSKHEAASKPLQLDPEVRDRLMSQMSAAATGSSDVGRALKNQAANEARKKQGLPPVFEMKEGGDVIRDIVAKKVKDASLTSEDLQSLGFGKTASKIISPIERGVAESAGGFLDPDNIPYMAMGGISKPVGQVLGKAFAGLMIAGGAKQGVDAATKLFHGDYEGALKHATMGVIQGGLGGLGAKAGEKPTGSAFEEGTGPIKTESEVPNASSQPKAAEVHGDVQSQPIEGAREVPPKESGAGVQPPVEPKEAKTGEVSLKPEPGKLAEATASTKEELHPEIQRFKDLSQEAFNEEAKTGGTGITGMAYKLAEQLTSEDIPALEKAREEWVEQNKATRAAAKTPEEKMAAYGKSKSTQFFEEAKRFRQAMDEAKETGATTKEQLAALETKHGVGYLDKGKSLMEALEREKSKAPEPEMVGMGAATPSEFDPAPIDWIENDPNIVRKTGLQSFIEKVAKNPSQSWGDAVTKGVSVARALKEYFRGQEKGGAAGREAATKELKVADKYLEADANNIRQSLTKLVTESLPVSERGRFVTAIANATKRPSITSDDPGVMYRNAAQVAARIEDRAHEYTKEQTIDDIKKTVSKAVDSPSVDINYKKKIQDAVKRVAFKSITEGTKSRLESTRQFIKENGSESVPDTVVAELDMLNKIPAKELPLDVLEAIRDRVQLLEKLGRLTVKTREGLWEGEKSELTTQMKGSDATKLEERPELRPQPGQKSTFTLNLRNLINRRMNNLANVDRGISPRDVMFDLMDGAKASYRGFMSRVFGGRIDSDFNRTLERWHGLQDPIEKFGKEQKFSDQDYERIGVYGVLKQESGRERLVEAGADPKVLDQIQSSMKPNELKMYDMMRKAMDSQLPAIQSLMRNLYNIDVKPVKGYFPLQRDWKLFEPTTKAPDLKAGKGEDVGFDELSAWKTLQEDYQPRPTTKAERGFTIERVPDAKTPVKIHAMDVVSRHLQNVSHLLETQRDLKMLGEVSRGDQFLNKYGAVGQKFTRDWLDTVAKQGGTEGFRRWAALDTLRRNSTIGVIGFRVASQLVHLANIPLAMNQAGPGWYLKGVRAAMSSEGQAFARKNFRETFARAGAEPAIEEAAAAKLLGIPIGKLTPFAFFVVKGIDRLNSQSTVLGIYQRLLSEKGIDPEMYDKVPVDEAARNEALIRARRAVASPLPKDVPQALSRGTLTGGNVSLGRAILQFQNSFLDQWSNVRHDAMRAGIGTGNARLAASTFAAYTAMVLIESGIKFGVQQATQEATGYKPRKDETYEKKATVEALRHVPFMGNVLSAIMYGESGIPAIDSLSQVAKSSGTMVTAKSDKGRSKAAIRAISGAAQAAGVPGASQVGEVIEKSQ